MKKNVLGQSDVKGFESYDYSPYSNQKIQDLFNYVWTDLEGEDSWCRNDYNMFVNWNYFDKCSYINKLHGHILGNKFIITNCAGTLEFYHKGHKFCFANPISGQKYGSFKKEGSKYLHAGNSYFQEFDEEEFGYPSSFPGLDLKQGKFLMTEEKDKLCSLFLEEMTTVMKRSRN